MKSRRNVTQSVESLKSNDVEGGTRGKKSKRETSKTDENRKLCSWTDATIKLSLIFDSFHRWWTIPLIQNLFSFQGGHVITPLPGATPMRPGAAVSLSFNVLLGWFKNFKCVVGFLCCWGCRFHDAKAVSTTKKKWKLAIKEVLVSDVFNIYSSSELFARNATSLKPNFYKSLEVRW